MLVALAVLALIALLRLRRWTRFLRAELRAVKVELEHVVETLAQKLLEKMQEQQHAIQNAVSVAQLGTSFPLFLDDASIDAHHARVLVQHLVERAPRTIVELGSGNSTLLIARVMQYVSPRELLHVAVDHDAGYLKISQEWASHALVSERVTFVLAPLAKNDRFETPWYSDFSEHFRGRLIDFLVVDGPPAYEDGASRARYPALPALHKHLARDCTILVDDANRAGESEMITRWLEQFPEFSVSKFARGKGVAVLERKHVAPE